MKFEMAKANMPRSPKTRAHATHQPSCGAYSLLLLLVPSCNSVDPSIRPPAQPESGPGGADYVHASITVERQGEGRDAYWLFYPDEPALETAPFVVFLHGWGAMQPDVYGAWIEHIVRKGHIVAYPRYQTSLLDTPEQMRNGALAGIANAWAQVVQAGRVDFLQAGVVWIGHSLGANFTAVLAPQASLPPPAALMLVEPGGRGIDLGDIRPLPPDTRVLIVVGEEDQIAGTNTADQLADQLLDFVPSANLETVTVHSERGSSSPLIADHFAPLAYSRALADFMDQVAPSSDGLLDGIRRERRAQYRPDALDFYGFWKLADGLLDWVYRGENLEYAMGGTPQQRFMGVLSNGAPVAPITIRRNE